MVYQGEELIFTIRAAISIESKFFYAIKINYFKDLKIVWSGRDISLDFFFFFNAVTISFSIEYNLQKSKS